MKFTLGWLKEHLDTQADVETIAATLTKIGLEVEGIDDPAARLAGFRIARVLTAAPHPQADKLQVLSVDAGDGPMQVVCGAPNARAGLVGVFGAPGAVVPANGMELRVAAIRGIESHGMMCSARELELGDDHDGIIELAADAPVGLAYADFANASDPVFDVAITPNRQDCMGVRGIARDLAAAGLGTLKPLAQVYRITSVDPVTGAGDGPDVRTDDPEGCPAFYAQSVSGVVNGQSPEWMAKMLLAVGQKPISALVDITNFVSIDLGRPLHVYDSAKLSGHLTARKGRDGPRALRALNNKDYVVGEDMTVIADDNGVQGLGGVMGGRDSEVDAHTKDVWIECAYFTPEVIARTGQRIGITSDARARFERGVDPAFLDTGLSIATQLVIGHCGGTPSPVTRAGTPPLAPKTFRYDPMLCDRLGGINLPLVEQKAILERLGFAVSAAWDVTVPSWRRDVDGPADLVEEVVRIRGIEHVISEPLPRDKGVAKPTATPMQKLERKLRRSAAALGLNEAITWSFISEQDAAAVGGGIWTLANPISEEMKVMRPSLLPGLLSAARRNLDRGASTVRLFELGRRYIGSGEHPSLTFVLAGDRVARSWETGKAQGFDAFDAKALCLALLEAGGAPVANLQVMGEAGDIYHPGQSATLRLGPKNQLASFGMVHPSITKTFGIDGPVIACGIHLDAIPVRKASGFMRPAFAPPTLQAVTRDFAFLAPADLKAGDLVRAVKAADKAHIVAARLFDRFEGAGVPEGQVSLAVEVTLQPAAKSFTEGELKAISDAIVAAAGKIGAALRA